jgi:hypothetical protein
MTLQEIFDESVSLIEEDLEKAIGGFHYLLNNDPSSSALVFYIGTCCCKSFKTFHNNERKAFSRSVE